MEALSQGPPTPVKGGGTAAGSFPHHLGLMKHPFLVSTYDGGFESFGVHLTFYVLEDLRTGSATSSSSDGS